MLIFKNFIEYKVLKLFAFNYFPFKINLKQFIMYFMSKITQFKYSQFIKHFIKSIKLINVYIYIYITIFLK